MDEMNRTEEITAAEIGQRTFPVDDSNEDQPAWVMIENGRYQPQRIKGSCLGRELG